MDLDKLKALAAKYAMVVGIIVGAFLLIGGVSIFVYYAMQSSGDINGTPTPTAGTTPRPDVEVILPTKEPDAFKPPARTTALVLGIQPLGGISDVMLLVTFDSVTNKIDVISLPRDTYITLPKEDVDKLHELGRRMTPTSGVMKLNELHSYAGNEYGPEYSKKYIQNMLNVDIDYTVVISTKAFRDIIDAAGGIYMEVRAKGYQYEAPDRYIDVPGGYQLLNGEKAEGVVRYRHDYPGGDLDRIVVQQQFMKAFSEQILNKDTIKSNWLSFLSTIVSYVKTDFGIDDIPKYLSSIEKIKPENIQFHSLPGVAQHINGGDYYVYSEEKGRILIDEIFTEPEEETPEETSPQTKMIIDKTLAIQILNGTHVNRLGTRKSEELTAAGYEIKNVGTYAGVKQAATRIMVKNMDFGEQFKSYFNNAIVETDAEMPSQYDVIIIIGTGETD